MVNKYYSMYEDGIIGGVVKESSEGNVRPESQPSTSASNRPRPWRSEDHEETLIQLVSNRAPLWDFRMPLKERGRNILKNLWKEIILEMNVDMTVEAISKKWKNIRDSYIRARANINKKLASGSSAEEKLHAEKPRKHHKNYEMLLFLDDSLTTRRTSSNLEEFTPTDELMSPPSTSRASIPSSRNQGQISAQDEVFLDAIRNHSGPRELTASQSFCLRLADRMKRLPQRIRNQLQVEFLQRLTEMENLYLYPE